MQGANVLEFVKFFQMYWGITKQLSAVILRRCSCTHRVFLALFPSHQSRKSSQPEPSTPRPRGGPVPPCNLIGPNDGAGRPPYRSHICPKHFTAHPWFPTKLLHRASLVSEDYESLQRRLVLPRHDYYRSTLKSFELHDEAHQMKL